MKFKETLLQGTLIKRYKRFFIDIKYGNETITAHCPNSGSMLGLLTKGNKVYFSKSDTIKNITLWKIITWISKMFNLSILFTSKQIQFSFIQFITRLLISNFIDSKYIENKNE